MISYVFFVDGNMQRNVKAEKEFYKNMSIFDLLCKHSASRTLLNSEILKRDMKQSWQ